MSTYPETVHVLVVDDEPRLVELITGYLRDVGLTTSGALDGPSGLDAAREPGVDVVVLDRMLPGMDGLEVCRRLREDGYDVPVLLLTARGAVPERVAGLDAGADDYLVKPFAMEELYARVRALARRREVPDTARLAYGDVVVAPGERRAWVAEEEVSLSRREFDVLVSLMQNAGRVVSRYRLFDDVFEDTDINSNALEVHVSRVRARLAGSKQVRITTLRGVGYRLDPVGR
ncbi:response regulator transcription factor [Nocardioides sp. KR10-350]|uniref:response regulator transcription factor n=1 Tax=Nocardioides cheoyonin TaxID=3156615 RepID=UPI0032B563C7